MSAFNHTRQIDAMAISRNSVNIEKPRDYRLDIIKAISICLVLIWHVNPFRPGDPLIRQLFSFFNRNFTLVAVPSFITVSLMIFLEKLSSGRTAYLRKRMIRLFTVFSFWLIVQFLVYALVTHEAPEFSLELIFFGGPGIPKIGASVFYFLSDLIVLTCAFYLFLILQDKTKLMISACIVTLTFFYFAASSTFGYRIPGPVGFGPYNYLLSFIIYVPLSYYLFRNMKMVIKFRYVIAILFILAVCYEEIMKVVFDVKLFAPYSRVSVVLGVILLFALAFKYGVKRTRYFSLLSKYSLGIYAVHKYFQLLSYKIYDAVHLNWIGFNGGIDMQYFIVFILTLIFTFCFIYLARNSIIRSYIS